MTSARVPSPRSRIGPPVGAEASAQDQPDMVGRRRFLGRGAMAGAAASGALGMNAAAAQVADAAPLGVAPWQTRPGVPAGGYGQPSAFEKTARHILKPYGDLAPGTGPTFSPIEALEGTMTPSGLHFVRNHNGVPEIDPAQHRLMLHGLVKRPLIFSVKDLLRYPTITRTHFIECAGNSSRALAPQPLQIAAGGLHGMVSCSEWTGIALSVLLSEAGIDPAANWLLAEGADASGMSRSIPLDKALDDAMIALYQNGERLRPEQGYPMRLLLPGWEGNMNVKWLRRLKLTDGPTQTRDETSKYTDPLPNGTARQFTFEMGVKSVITSPSSGMKLPAPGFVEISGIAWSGAGRISGVEVSVDGGLTWQPAALQGQALPKSLVRFRAPWVWSGAPALLQSRAVDEKGHTQPTRKAFISEYAPDNKFHNNSVITWQVNADGSVKNVYV